jgi:hypothetical protein
MTPQEIFDGSVLPLIRQGRPALKQGLCAYRGSDGTKCAVGHLITDEEYTSDMEGNDAVMLHSAEMLPDRLVRHLDLLGYLQDAHDETSTQWRRKRAFRSRFAASAAAVARRFNLSTANLNALMAELEQGQ